MTSTRIAFWLDDRFIEEDSVPGTTTLLRYLRDNLHLTGTKEGCAEGDCGACTVVVLEDEGGGPTYRAINSCLVFLPMLQGKRVYTVQALRDRDRAMDDAASGFHPVQRAMVDHRGSQCGYCTPGIVMSLFEACYREDLDEDWKVDDQVSGNLCRCTGYRPIRAAAHEVAGARPEDRFLAELRHYEPGGLALSYRAGGQTYLQPTTLDELWAARAAHPEAVLVAGGTDVGLEVTKRHRFYPEVIGLEGLASLRRLERLDHGWSIGAGVRLTRLLEVVSGRLPALEKMLRVFGARQIRSRATVGGNLCNASPIGDLAPVFLSLGAVAVAVGPGGERAIPLDDFFPAYRTTALRDDEILLRIELPDPPVGAWCTSYKVSKRRELDISTVAAGMMVRLDGPGRVAEVRLAFGGVAATPVRAGLTEAALVGCPWTEDEVRRVMPVLDQDFSPISDQRGSADYRRLVARNLLLGFYLESQRGDRDQLLPRPTAAVTPSGRRP